MKTPSEKLISREGWDFIVRACLKESYLKGRVYAFRLLALNADMTHTEAEAYVEAYFLSKVKTEPEAQKSIA